ncbi:MAG TPA: hypothetical protein VNK43_12420 [Gemmatimonadales bacterium]|nr:hypothetical protein [Gemmatimonadales bacterium]
MGSLRQPTAPAGLSESPAARHMGDLVRGEARWSVYLETKADGNTAIGRLHFYDGSRRRSSAWIFREWTEPEILERFNGFSPVQLWDLLESLG